MSRGSNVCLIPKVLLSQDELLQLSGVQCIAEVLMHHTDYGRVLLSADIAGQLSGCHFFWWLNDIMWYITLSLSVEFMLEALSSKNELLLQ